MTQGAPPETTLRIVTLGVEPTTCAFNTLGPSAEAGTNDPRTRKAASENAKAKRLIEQTPFSCERERRARSTGENRRSLSVKADQLSFCREELLKYLVG
jgi:hypothetical protein